PVLADAIIRYHGEPNALVVADSFEIARAAAAVVTVHCAVEAPELDLEAGSANAYKPERAGPGFAPDTSRGDFDAAFAQSDVRGHAIYRNGYQNHNPIEPPGALAQWEDDRLTVYASQQHVANARGALAATLQVPTEKIRLISRY